MTTYIAYVDGACPNNGKPNAKAGWGAYITNPEGKTLKLAAPVPRDQPQTNNRAELLAALKALKRCNKPMPITVYSDSEFVVKGANEWLPNWKAKGWKNSSKKSVAHRDLGTDRPFHRATGSDFCVGRGAHRQPGQRGS